MEAEYTYPRVDNKFFHKPFQSERLLKANKTIPERISHSNKKLMPPRINEYVSCTSKVLEDEMAVYFPKNKSSIFRTRFAVLAHVNRKLIPVMFVQLADFSDAPTQLSVARLTVIFAQTLVLLAMMSPISNSIFLLSLLNENNCKIAVGASSASLIHFVLNDKRLYSSLEQLKLPMFVKRIQISELLVKEVETL